MNSYRIHFKSLSQFSFPRSVKVAMGVLIRKMTGLFSPYDLIAKTTFDFLLEQGAKLKRTNGLVNIEFKPSYSAIPVHFNIRLGTTDIVIFNELLMREGYRPAIELQKKLNLPVEYIIDAGANVGAATVYLKSYFPSARLIAVEPAETNFSTLDITIANNGFSDVILFKGALWYRNKKLTLKDFFRGEREKELSFHVQEAQLAESTGDIEGVTIEQLMKQYGFPRIDILKVDIEGAEKMIFDDPANYLPLLSKVGILAIEIHEEVFDKWKFINDLENAGFNQINIGEILYVYRNKG